MFRKPQPRPSSSAPEPAAWSRWLPALGLFALAFVVYAPALGGPFLWDDGRAITNNPAFQSPSPLAAIWAGHGDPDYLPVKTTWLWLIYRLFGDTTWPYHAANVAVHAANAVLLWRVLRRLAIAGAWFAGLIFLIHPTHVESVAWISECKNTLSLCFGLLATLAWLAYRRERRAGQQIVALVLFAAGLLCKSHLVVLPVALLLCAWWQDRRTHDDGEARPRGWRWLGRALARLTPFFALAALSGGLALWFQSTRAIRDYQLPAGALPSRIANAGKATWWYLGKSLTPVHPWYELADRPVESEPEAQAVLAGLRPPNPAPAWPVGRLTLRPSSMIYPRWRVTAPVWYDFLPGIAMIALFAFVVRRRARWPGAFMGLSFFLLALLPVLGVVKLSYMRASWVADHFQYLADIGIIALGCAAGAVTWRRLSSDWRRPFAAAVAMVSVGYGTASFARARDYASEHALWGDTVRKNPGAWQARNRFGVALLARGDVAGAATQFEAAVRAKPDDSDGRNNLGLALVALGRVEEGITQYRESLRLDGGQFFAHANLGDALAKLGRHAEAVAAYRGALRREPRLPPLHFRSAMSLIELGRWTEAEASLRAADALAPRDPEIAAAFERLRQQRAAADSKQ